MSNKANNDMGTVLKAVNNATQLKDIEKQKENIEAMRTELLKGTDEDLANHIDKISQKFTSEKIKKMSEEEFDKEFIFNDSKIRLGEKGDFEFTKELIALLRLNDETSIQVDEALEGIQKANEESQAELDKILSEEYHSMSALLRAKMAEDLSRMTDTAIRKKIEEDLRYYDDGPKLTEFEKWCLDEPNEIMAQIYYDESAGKAILKRFTDIAKKHNLPIHGDNLQKVGNLEMINLPKEYHKVNNIFLFMWIRYAANKLEHISKSKKSPIKLYIIRIALLIKEALGQGGIDSGEKKEFIESVKRILDKKDLSLYKELVQLKDIDLPEEEVVILEKQLGSTQECNNEVG